MDRKRRSGAFKAVSLQRVPEALTLPGTTSIRRAERGLRERGRHYSRSPRDSNHRRKHERRVSTSSSSRRSSDLDSSGSSKKEIKRSHMSKKRKKHHRSKEQRHTMSESKKKQKMKSHKKSRGRHRHDDSSSSSSSDSDTIRSAISGKKIKRKLDRSAADVQNQKSRLQLLQFYNGMFD